MIRNGAEGKKERNKKGAGDEQEGSRRAARKVQEVILGVSPAQHPV